MYGQQGIGTYDEDDEVYENKYYQWVCYTLLIQVKQSQAYVELNEDTLRWRGHLPCTKAK